MGDRKFYSTTGEYVDELVEGKSLKVEHTVQYDHFRFEIPEISVYVTKPPEELEKQREDSAKKEQALYSKIQSEVTEWEAQAAHTLLLDKAIEYVHTPTVQHTSNEWRQLKDESWEISNLVYKMSYKMWKDDAGEKKGTWLVSWKLEVNPPDRPSTEGYYYTGESTIAEQRKKRYDTFDAAQRYIQGRFDLYAPLFVELCPPVPDDFKRHFYINGCLLPGYTVAQPEKTTPDKEAIADLLAYLEDTDIPPASQPPKPEISVRKPPAPLAENETAQNNLPRVPLKRKPVRQTAKKSNRKKKAALER